MIINLRKPPSGFPQVIGVDMQPGGVKVTPAPERSSELNIIVNGRPLRLGPTRVVFVDGRVQIFGRE